MSNYVQKLLHVTSNYSICTLILKRDDSGTLLTRKITNYITNMNTLRFPKYKMALHITQSHIITFHFQENMYTEYV